MKRAPNSTEVRGKIDEVAGTVKEKAGRVMGDVNLENKGAAQRAAGNVEAGIGRTRRKVSEALDGLGDKINKS